jgi:probable HAF family extracellular repeat protein
MVGLGSLPGGVGGSIANAVSGDGSVIVGTAAASSGNNEAFRWTPAGGMVDLGHLPGGNLSAANAVSADGSVVVGYSNSNLVGTEAFRWTAGGGMVGLGILPGGHQSIANGVSADGSVVVGGGEIAFRWKAGTGIQRVWDVLLAQGVDPAAEGWTQLSSANAISADGNTIVGNGFRDGHAEAFVAIVPEPGGLAVIALAALALCRRRQTRSTAALLTSFDVTAATHR